MALEDLSDVVSQPGRILATPELKAKVGYRTELTANSFSRGCQQSSTRKITNLWSRFPSARLLATPKLLISPAPPSSPRFPRSLPKTRKYCACSRIFFPKRGPERLGFGRQQLIYARFSLSRIEPVPFRAILRQKTRASPFSEEIRLFLFARTTLGVGLIAWRLLRAEGQDSFHRVPV